MITPLEAATPLRAWGFCVLPAKFRKKMPTVEWKGRSTLPTDAELDDWFGKISLSSYWILCGRPSRLAVLDCDNQAAIDWAKEAIGTEVLDATPCVKTTRGFHWYFQLEEGEVVESWDSRDAKISIPGASKDCKCELKAEKTGIICPPSIHESGIVYKWLRSPDEGMQPLPAILRRTGGGTATDAALTGEKKPKEAKETLATLLATLPGEGGRNDWLTRVCGHLARQHDHKDGYLANVRLVNASLPSPLTEAEAAKTAGSIWQAEQRRQALPAPEFIPNDLTESSAAHVFAGKHAGKLWYIPGAGWFVYKEEEGRFREEEDGALHLMQQTMMAMRAEAVARDWKPAITFGTAATSSRGLRAILALAQIEPSLRAASIEFDAHPDLLNVRNGVLDLATGELREHSPKYKFTQCAGTEWLPETPAPLWLAHLERIFSGDTELILFMQRWLGRALSGISPSDNCRILMPYGLGANGKTVTVETIAALMGEYARARDFTTWCVGKENSGSTQRQDLVELAGVRLVTATESGYHHSLDEALLKAYTGGEKVSPRGMFAKKSRVFVPQFSLLLSTNHLPRLEGSDRGFWRRFLKIGFNVEIPEPDQDHQLLAKLKQELPGVLVWAQRGYQDWRKRGLDPPTSVLLETAEYRGDIDWVGQFVEQHLAYKQGGQADLKPVYHTYRSWCEDCGITRPLTLQQFVNRLAEHKIKKTSNSYTRRVSLVDVELVDREPRLGMESWLK